MVPASVVMQSSTAGDMREEMMKMKKTLKILLWSVAVLAAAVTGAASCGRRQAAPLSDVERLALDGDTAAIRKMLERGKPGDGFAEALLLAEGGDSAPDASYFEEKVEAFDDAGDTRRAVVALYYLGKTHYRHKQLKPATMALKEAQQRLRENPDSALEWYVAKMLFFINEHYGDKGLADSYARHAYDLGVAMRDTVKVYKSITYRTAALRSLGRKGKATRLMQSAVSLAPGLRVRDKAGLYNNIGFVLLDSLPGEARGYFEKAISYMPISTALANLALINAGDGRMEVADSLWRRAMRGASPQLQSEILGDIFRFRMNEGSYRDACDAAVRLIACNDSIARDAVDSDVYALQLEWDHNLERRKTLSDMRMLLYMVVVSLLVAAVVVLWFFYRRARMNEALAMERLSAEALSRRIAELESKAASDSKVSEVEIERLRKRLGEMKGRQAEIYANGHARFAEVEAGAPIVRWSKKDIDDCVEYYSMLDMAYMTELDTMYSGLTSKNRLFLILEHIGKSDAEIQEIFGVSPNAIRTLRSRLRAKAVD